MPDGAGPLVLGKALTNTILIRIMSIMSIMSNVICTVSCCNIVLIFGYDPTE